MVEAPKDSQPTLFQQPYYRKPRRSQSQCFFEAARLTAANANSVRLDGFKKKLKWMEYFPSPSV